MYKGIIEITNIGEEGGQAVGGERGHGGSRRADAAMTSVERAPTQVVHLSEKNMVLIECPDGVWVLDTGANNHMTGTRSTLTYLDNCSDDGGAQHIRRENPHLSG
jgi:environmental stress-induced protein Ves